MEYQAKARDGRLAALAAIGKDRFPSINAPQTAPIFKSRRVTGNLIVLY